jgi:hypothetical protein
MFSNCKLYRINRPISIFQLLLQKTMEEKIHAKAQSKLSRQEYFATLLLGVFA